MIEANLTGYWTGELKGTNSGGLAIEFKQEGNRLSGIGKFHEPSLGAYQYAVQGVISDRVSFFLTPNPSQFINLGRVTANGRLVDQDSLCGTWQSTLGTEGTFSIKRHMEDVTEAPQGPEPAKNSLFIVHGHDNGAKQELARFVEKLGLEATILHEKTNRGLTLIEKFEKYSGLAGAAIVLFTPDDVGHPFGQEKQIAPRARQNVVLELGYFIGKLGRGKVVILYKQGVELPSDVLGVVYIEMDTNEAWKLQVAKELRDIGYAIDLNKI